jgi:hypothetical protein
MLLGMAERDPDRWGVELGIWMLIRHYDRRGRRRRQAPVIHTTIDSPIINVDPGWLDWVDEG